MPNIVDIHTHCTLPSKEDRFGVGDVMRGVQVGRNRVVNFRNLPSIMYHELTDFDLQQEVSARAGVSVRMISSPFFVEAVTQVTRSPVIDVVRHGNDEIARIIARSPQNCFGFGTLNPLDSSQISEAERCMGPLGFKALLICSSWHGRFLDNEESYPFWEWAQGQGVPIFIHPPRVPIGHEQQMDQYKLDELVGRPFDTAMGLARMILSGLFDRFPRLTIIVAHMGGGLLPVMGRLDFGWRLGGEGMPERAAIQCRELPSSYLRHLYVDTMGLWAPHLREAVEVFGADNVLFGTDYGPVPIDPKEHVDIINGLPIAPADKEKILWRNADRLFDLQLDGKCEG